jgi:signal transduction histidine kinase
MIYPSKVRVRCFAVGNILAGLVALGHHLQVRTVTSLMVVEGLCFVLATILLIKNEQRSPEKPLNMLFYGLVIWYTLFMSNVWAYVVDDFSQIRLVMLLLAIGVYYLMVEWWHVLWAILLATGGAYFLSYILGREVYYPPPSDWMLVITAHFCWLGYAITNKNKRDTRIRDAQSLVRHIQRSLQPGLQSIETILPDLKYTIREVGLKESQKRLHDISIKLKNNTQFMQDYLDLQTVNARHISFEERVERLTASSLVKMAVDEYPYTSNSFRRAVIIEVENDFEFIGSQDQWLYAFRNLLDNSLSAIFYNARKPKIGDVFIKIKKYEGRGIIRFRDRGIGVPPDQILNIFDPFFTMGKFSGLGLGLSFTKMVVEGAGGEISCKSSDLNGTSFSVFLPCLMAMQEKSEIIHASV